MESAPVAGGFDRLQRLIDALDTRADFTSFGKALDGPLTSALASVDFAGSCAALLDTLAADPHALGPRASAAAPATLVNASGSIRLELPSATPKRGGLTGSPSHRLFGVISGELRVRRWRHEQIWEPSVFSSDVVLTPLGDCALGPGQTLAADAWRDVVDLSGTAAVIVLRSAPRHTVMWQYDRVSLRPTGLIAATEQLARVEEALDILTRLGTSEDAGACRVLAGHASHAIRWAAVRFACNAGAACGYELLEAATRDPHPDVREGARKALAAAVAAQVAS